MNEGIISVRECAIIRKQKVRSIEREVVAIGNWQLANCNA